MVLSSVAIVIAALYLAREVLVPIALAILLTFLLTPLVYRLERFRMPRGAAVTITAAIAFAVLGAIGYVVYNQLDELALRFREYHSNIQSKVDSFRNGDGFLSNVKRAREDVRHIFSRSATAPTSQPVAAGTAQHPLPRAVPVVVTNRPDEPASDTGEPGPLQLLEDIGGRILGPVGTAFIVIVFTIFMLLQREDLRDRLIRLIGRSRLTVTTEAMDDAAARVSRYLVMQSIINGAVGVAVMLLLWIVGRLNGIPFPSPALFGLLVALLRFIPYVGIWVAAAMPLLLSLAVYPSAGAALEVIGGLVIIEIVAANVLEPMLFGASTGLTTLAVLVAAAFWTWLWGPIGLLLSTPMTVCVVVIGKYVPGLSFLTIMLADEAPLLPHDRVYQRLLAADEEEAEELVDQYAAKMPLEELYDTVLVPVLAMAERDRHVGNLEEDRHGTIRRGVREIVDELGDRQRNQQSRADSQAVVDQARDRAAPGGGNGQGKAPAAPALSIAQPPPGVRVALPQGCTINVVCLPAHDESDEIAGLMFSQLLEIRGFCAESVSVEQLASEMMETVERLKAHVVCVSALPPGAVRHARYLCKRLRAKLPDVRMIIGLWTIRGDLKKSKQRIACTGEAQLTGSLVEAIEQVHQMVQAEILGGERANAMTTSTEASNRK